MESWQGAGRDLELMLLGAVLANRTIAKEVFAAMEGPDLEERDLAGVFGELKAAMTKGDSIGEGTKRWLKRRGAEVKDGRAIDAVLDAVKERIRRKRLERMLAELRMANTLGDLELVAELTAKLKP